VTDSWAQHKLTADYWLRTTQRHPLNRTETSTLRHGPSAPIISPHICFLFEIFDFCSTFFHFSILFFFLLLFCFVCFCFDFDVITHIPSLHQKPTTHWHQDQLAIVHQVHLHSKYHLYSIISSRANTSGDHHTSAGHHLGRPGAELQPYSACGPNGTVLFPWSHPTTQRRQLEKRWERGRERERESGEREERLEGIDMRLTWSRWRRL